MLPSPGPGPLSELAGAWAAGLLTASAKGTVLLLGALAADRLLRSRPAAVRHLVWAAALVGLLLLPALTGVVPRIEVPGLPRISAGAPAAGPTEPDPARQGAAPAGSAETGLDGRRAGGAPAAASRGRTSASGSASPWLAGPGRSAALAGLWLLGTLGVLAWMAAGRMRIWWLSRGATRIRDGPWSRTAGRLADRLGLRRSVRLLRGSGSTVPMTWGVLRPKILLPVEAGSWTEACRRNVLLHELAHVRRGDYLMRLVGRVAVAAYWFHPMAWMAFRRLRREQEAACDDYVLRAGVRPSEYAGQLVGLARRLRTVGSAAHVESLRGGPSEFFRRMRSLLRDDRPRERVPPGHFALLCAAAALAVGGLAAAGPPSGGEAVGDPPGRGTGAVSAVGVELPEVQVAAPDRPRTGSEVGAGLAAGGHSATARGRAAPSDGAGRPDVEGPAAAAARGSDELEPPAGPDERRSAPAAAAAGPGSPPAGGGSIDSAPPRDPGIDPPPSLVRGGLDGSAVASGRTASGGRPSPLEAAAREATRAAAAGDAPFPGASRPETDGAGTATTASPPAGDRACSGGCSAEGVLGRLAALRDSAGRLALLRGLARSPSGRSAAVLMELSYRASRASDRRMAVRALADVPGPTRDRYLYQVARANPWVAVRAAAIDQLGRSDGEKIVPWLVSLAYHDVSPEVQKFAVGVLARLDRSGVDSGLLQIARSHPEDQVRRRAVYWLLKTGDRGALSRLVDSA